MRSDNGCLLLPADTHGEAHVRCEHKIGQPVTIYFPRFGVWRLVHDFLGSVGRWSFCIKAPLDYDLASVPRIVWPLIGKHELGTIAPLVHDWLYRWAGEVRHGWVCKYGAAKNTFTRAEVDSLFLEIMKHEGVSWWRRTLAYSAVRVGGRGSWGSFKPAYNPEI